MNVLRNALALTATATLAGSAHAAVTASWGSLQATSSNADIVNPGSVGQPRDRDPRASYAMMDDEQIEFIRLEYDIPAVVEKVKAIRELSDFLGQRLIEGR